MFRSLLCLSVCLSVCISLKFEHYNYYNNNEKVLGEAECTGNDATRRKL
jgi:hypothetical protein